MWYNARKTPTTPFGLFNVPFLLLLFLGGPGGARASGGGTDPAIGKNDDAAKILGQRAAERDMGQPAPLTKAQREALTNVYTDPGEIPQLTVEVDGKTLELPLKHTHVKAEITGYVARVVVTQTYQNPFTYPIEAIYIFPLPENSAVDDMKMVIGDRVIESDIKKREEARRTYETAKQQGHTAALLEQERPNVFTQSVANIEPGTEIDVEIRYAQNLTYDAGEYELVFPMVVGPRFIPGAPTGKRSGTGWSADTNEVPDASRITPPVVGGGLRTGHDISLELVANAGLPISTWEVPTHDVNETPTFDGTLKLALAEHDSIPNRDFVLKYRVDGKQTQATLLAHKNGDVDRKGYFSLIIQPPKLDVDELVGQREIIFVVDVSGSMSGVPLAMCKDAMAEALGKLRPVDTFNVITFESRTGKLFEVPRPANDTNLKAATEFVDGLNAGGGTMMGLGVQEALSPAVAEGRHRYVFFMTDGYIGNESTIMQGTRTLVQALERRGQKAKVFSFGTGSSPNRHLLDGLAKAGRGIAVYSSTREDPTLAVNRFYRYIDHSILRDLRIDWGGLDVDDVFPRQLPDLFASRPLVVHGRFGAPGSSEIIIRGKAGHSEIAIPVAVELPAESHGNAVLRPLWARTKIDGLEKDLIYNGHSQQVVDEITKLGLGYRLVTAYTSFVAVDRSKTVDGILRTITQPVETPEGVDPHAAGAMVLQPAKSVRSSSAYGGGAAEGGQMALGKRVGTRKQKLAPGHYAPSMPAPPPVAAAESASPSSYAFDAPSESAPVRAPRLESKGEKEAPKSGLIVRGALGQAAVKSVLDAHQAAFLRCYETHFAGRTKPHGTLEARFFITGTGNVIQVKVKGLTLKDEALARALAEIFTSLRFAQPSDGAPVEVRYVLSF